MEEVRDIVEVKPLPDYKVWVRFETGEQGVFDCMPYLADSFWSPLREIEFFNTVRVEDGSLMWGEDIDLCQDDIWEMFVQDKSAEPIGV